MAVPLAFHKEHLLCASAGFQCLHIFSLTVTEPCEVGSIKTSL